MEQVVLPSRVRSAMASKGWDQSQLAASANVAASAVSRLLSSGSAHAATIKSVALALGVSTDYLYGIGAGTNGDDDFMMQLRTMLNGMDEQRRGSVMEYAAFQYQRGPLAADERELVGKAV